jgi:uncharacterized protein YpuA (DUF1002 family)
MKSWRLITGVVLVLVLGILIGGAGTHLYLRHKYHFSLDRKDRAAHLLKTFSRELDLSQDQKIAVEKILQRMVERLHSHMLQRQPEAERIVDESFSEIRQQLTDEQKKQFDSLQARHRRHRHYPDR